MKIICFCGKKFDVGEQSFSLPKHVNEEGTVCNGSFILGNKEIINLSPVDKFLKEDSEKAESNEELSMPESEEELLERILKETDPEKLHDEATKIMEEFVIDRECLMPVEFLSARMSLAAFCESRAVYYAVDHKK